MNTLLQRITGAFSVLTGRAPNPETLKKQIEEKDRHIANLCDTLTHCEISLNQLKRERDAALQKVHNVEVWGDSRSFSSKCLELQRAARSIRKQDKEVRMFTVQQSVGVGWVTKTIAFTKDGCQNWIEAVGERFSGDLIVTSLPLQDNAEMLAIRAFLLTLDTGDGK
jgi:hypothetical protein